MYLVEQGVKFSDTRTLGFFSFLEWAFLVRGGNTGFSNGAIQVYQSPQGGGKHKETDGNTRTISPIFLCLYSYSPNEYQIFFTHTQKCKKKSETFISVSLKPFLFQCALICLAFFFPLSSSIVLGIYLWVECNDSRIEEQGRILSCAL